MGYIALEKMIKGAKSSLYRIALTAASRANELAQGAKPLVKTSSKKISTIALEEVAAGKVSYEEGKAKDAKESAE